MLTFVSFTRIYQRPPVKAVYIFASMRRQWVIFRSYQLQCINTMYYSSVLNT